MLDSENYQHVGGMFWYNEAKGISQLRRIYLTGPKQCATEISESTMVIQLGYDNIKLGYNGRIKVDKWAYALYFGSESSYNIAYLRYDHVSLRFLGLPLVVLRRAIRTIRDIHSKDRVIRDVKIRVRDEGLPDIFVWKRDQFPRNPSGKDANDIKLYRKVIEDIETERRALGAAGVVVELWLTCLDYLRDATDLAFNILEVEFPGHVGELFSMFE